MPLSPHSFIPGLKPSFSANPSPHSLPFLLQDWFPGFPGPFADTSKHTYFYFFCFSTFYLLVPCGKLSWFMSAFNRTLKQHLVSNRTIRSWTVNTEQDAAKICCQSLLVYGAAGRWIFSTVCSPRGPRVLGVCRWCTRQPDTCGYTQTQSGIRR